FSAHRYDAVRGGKQSRREHQQRALAAAARPENRKKLALPLCERYLIECPHWTVGGGIDLGEIAKLEIGLLRSCRRHSRGRRGLLGPDRQQSVVRHRRGLPRSLRVVRRNP